MPHFWQTESRLASEIIEYLAGDLTVSFLIDDFIVRKEDFVATGESPLELINKLASVIGGYIRTDLDDTVIIKYHKFNTEGAINVSLIDHENILLLNETEDLPEGYNKILVRGAKDSTPEQNAELEIELDEERNEERTEFNFTEDIWLRVYRAPFDINYYYTTSLGELTLVTENIAETIEREESEFVERTLTTQHPIDTIISIEKYDCSEVLPIEYSFERGYKYITTNEDVDTENEPVLISYSTKYDLYKLNVTQPCDPLIFEEVLSRITVIQI
jgi:hypothetical protein